MTAVVAVACAPFSSIQGQPASIEADLSSQLDRLALDVEEQQAESPRSPDLIESLRALAALHEQRGDIVRAITSLDSAIELSRINFGLSSPRQTPLIEQQIAIFRESENHAAAWNLEQQLVSLARRNVQDPRMAGVLTRVANRRAKILTSYVSGDFPPEITLGCYYEIGTPVIRNCMAGRKSEAARALLLDVRHLYEDALIAFDEDTVGIETSIEQIEAKLLTMNFLYGHYLIPPMRYEYGKARLEAEFEESETDRDSLFRRVEALVAMADWELHYARNNEALNLYERARLEAGHAKTSDIENLFQPDVPIRLPGFLPNPFQTQSKTAEYVDIQFELTRFGRPRQVKVLEASSGIPTRTKRKLRRLIITSHFRPRIDDEGLAQTSIEKIRYYLDSPTEIAHRQ